MHDGTCCCWLEKCMFMKFVFFLQLRRLTAYDVDIDGITHDELLTLTSQIHHKSKAALEGLGLLLEADRAGKGDVLRGAWKQDVEGRAAFQKDQKSNGKCGCSHMEEPVLIRKVFVSILGIESWIHVPLHSDWNERKQVEPDYNQDG